MYTPGCVRTLSAKLTAFHLSNLPNERKKKNTNIKHNLLVLNTLHTMYVSIYLLYLPLILATPQHLQRITCYSNCSYVTGSQKHVFHFIFFFLFTFYFTNTITSRISRPNKVYIYMHVQVCSGIEKWNKKQNTTTH